MTDLSEEISRLAQQELSAEEPASSPTKVYLAYAWTEEREGKSHIAICSTLAKAQEACQRISDDRCRDYGIPVVPLQWNRTPIDTWAADDPAYGDDYPYEGRSSGYEIEGFDMDHVSVVDPTAPLTFKRVRL